MGNILIIRSVSFQQLDYCLPAVIRKFPGDEIHLLTHEHGKDFAVKYRDIDKVYRYPYRESFSYWRRRTGIKSRHYDSVVIPVSNVSGSGFDNVFLFCLRIPSTTIYMCTLVADLKKVSFNRILLVSGRNLLFRLVAMTSGLILGPVISSFFLLRHFLAKVRRGFEIK